MARCRRGATALLGATAVLGGLLIVAGLWPVDALGQDLTTRLAPPSWSHPLGTDQLGRDVLARLLGGIRWSIGVTAVALTGCAVLGVTLGLAAGYRRGWTAQLLLSGIDVLVSVPAVVFGLVLAAALRPGLPALVLAILLVGWTTFARLSYQLTVREVGKPYVEAAVAIGARSARIVWRHILPNIARPLIAHSCAQFANVLLAVAGLSFLGLGAPPPTPEWGAMLAEGRRYLYTAPWLVLAPGAAIVLVTAAVTVLGRALQQRWSTDQATAMRTK